MELIDREEHLGCYNYDHSKRPMIEVVRITKDTKNELRMDCNEIVFILEGRVRYAYQSYPEKEHIKGQILFLPAGGRCAFTAFCNTVMMVFRLNNSIRLCDSYPIERLYDENQAAGKLQNASAILEINPRLWYFLDGINDCLADGIKCKSYFEIKIKEFFTMLLAYYPKEQIRDFLSLILTLDTAFSEQVRLNWYRYRTVEELAESMNLSVRVFSIRFKRVFNEPPYKWILKERSQAILHDLVTTDKPFKQIAAENHFSCVAPFSTFCKKEFGKTPTEIRFKKAYAGQDN